VILGRGEREKRRRGEGVSAKRRTSCSRIILVSFAVKTKCFTP